MDSYTKGSILYALKNLTFQQLKEFMFISSEQLYLSNKDRLNFDVVDLADRIIIVCHDNALKAFKLIKEILTMMESVDFVINYMNKCIENTCKKVSFYTPLVKNELLINCPKTSRKNKYRFRHIKPIDCRLRRRLF
ncbi:IFN-inducible protein [Hypsugopox virus]|nr:IFN-inducible protein [Hypsugopox virus]